VAYKERVETYLHTLIFKIKILLTLKTT